jgi:hypothetical protein
MNAGLRVSADEYLKTRTTNKTMKNRSIILTAIPSLLAFGGLSYTALAQVAAPAPAARTTTPVTVVNTATNPVPITGTVGVAENAARNAVQQEIHLTFTPGGGEGAESSITIPAGKIFVLETVSYFSSFAGLADVIISVIGPAISGGQSAANYFLVITPSNFVPTGCQALRLYVQPGTNLTVTANLTSAADAVVTVSLSGYFVNAQ